MEDMIEDLISSMRMLPAASAGHEEARAAAMQALAPLLDDQRTSDLSPSERRQVMFNLEFLWSQSEAPKVPAEAIAGLVRVVEYGATEAALAQPRRVGLALGICKRLMTPANANLEAEMASAGLPLKLLQCVRRWSFAGAAPTKDLGLNIQDSSGLSSYGPAYALAMAGAALGLILGDCPATADDLVAGTPGSAAEVANVLLAAAHTGPAGLLGMMCPLGELARRRDEWAVKIYGDAPLMAAVVTSVRRLEHVTGAAEMPTLKFLCVAAFSRNPGIAPVVLRLPGLAAACMAVLGPVRDVQGPGHLQVKLNPQKDALNLKHSLLLLSRLLDPPSYGDAEVTAAAVAIAASNREAVTRVFSLMSHEDPHVATVASQVAFAVSQWPEAMVHLQSCIEPQQMVDAAISALQHKDLDAQRAPEEDSTRTPVGRRHLAAQLALRSLTMYCAATTDAGDAARTALTRCSMPGAVVRRLIEAISREVTTLVGNSMWVVALEVTLVLQAAILRCARAGKLRPLDNAPGVLAAVLRVVVEHSGVQQQRLDVVGVLSVAQTMLQQAAACGAPLPWGPEAQAELQRAINGVQALIAADSGDSVVGSSAGAQSRAGGRAGMGTRPEQASERRVRDGAAPAGTPTAATSQSTASRQAGGAATATTDQVPAARRPRRAVSPAAPAPAAQAAAASPAVARVCASCGATGGTDGVRLLLCRGCQSVRYCNEACAQADWRSHKQACRAAAAAAKAAAAAGGAAAAAAGSSGGGSNGRT